MVRDRKERLESRLDRRGSSSAVVVDEEVDASSASRDQGFLEWISKSMGDVSGYLIHFCVHFRIGT